MGAIQQDAIKEQEQEQEELINEEDQLSKHESEIERIAESLNSDEEDFDEEEQDAEVINPNPLYRDGDKWYATTKIDGVEEDVEWQNIVAQYQKNSTADKRLQEASERQRSLDEYEQKLEVYRKQLESYASQPSTDAGEAGEVSPSDSDATDALYEQYHEALFQGDESEASKLLKQIRTSEKPSAQINVDNIIERTKAEIREEERRSAEAGYEARRREAVEKFREEFPAIVEDPSLLAVADRRSAELYQENPSRDPWEIMQECAEYAQEWLYNYVDELGKSDSDERKKRKQDMDDVAPRSVRSSIGEDKAEPTYSDIIAEMRNERGQYA